LKILQNNNFHLPKWMYRFLIFYHLSIRLNIYYLLEKIYLFHS
jgi:hypothetical protein